MKTKTIFDTDFEVAGKELIENTNNVNDDNLISSNVNEMIEVKNDKKVTMEGDDGNEGKKLHYVDREEKQQKKQT